MIRGIGRVREVVGVDGEEMRVGAGPDMINYQPFGLQRR